MSYDHSSVPKQFLRKKEREPNQVDVAVTLWKKLVGGYFNECLSLHYELKKLLKKKVRNDHY